MPRSGPASLVCSSRPDPRPHHSVSLCRHLLQDPLAALWRKYMYIFFLKETGVHLVEVISSVSACITSVRWWTVLLSLFKNRYDRQTAALKHLDNLRTVLLKTRWSICSTRKAPALPRLSRCFFLFKIQSLRRRHLRDALYCRENTALFDFDLLRINQNVQLFCTRDIKCSSLMR